MSNMANQQHVDMLLHGGISVWNGWRDENPNIQPDLFMADLFMADLSKASLREANLSYANASHAHLFMADLSGANLFMADLSNADLLMANLSHANLFMAHLSDTRLFHADLTNADLANADLTRARLSEADLSEAQLYGTNLREVSCVRANLSRARLTGCQVYGISAWDLNLEGTVQADLHITPESSESNITVDNLEVAQFLYLLLQNEKMRTVLDIITSKVVMILGRFSASRKPILNALREALRRHPNGYVPVLFDFQPQADKPVLETVKTLANLARFVIADLTDPHMVRAELTAIIPNAPTVPVQSIIQGNSALPTEHESWALYHSVLPVYRYADLPDLLANLNESVIAPVEAHVHARRL
jgi:hypothetical protein